MKKCNFGCGSIQPDDWVNVDQDISFYDPEKKRTIFYSIDGFGDNVFDIAVAHCAIQTNEWKLLPALFRQLYKLLTSGGVIRISLPDINKGFEAYKEGNVNFFPNSEEDIHIRFCAWLTWYSTTKTLLTQQALYKLLKEAGFSEVIETRFKLTSLSTHEITELDTREGECYFIEARK